MGPPGASLTQTANSFDGNTLAGASGVTPYSPGGGGEWIQGFSATIRSDRFTSNAVPAAVGASSQAKGGGLGLEACLASPATTVRMENLVAAGNTIAGDGRGAGVYAGGCGSAPLDLWLRDSTIAGNRTTGAGATGGLLGGAGDSLTLRNSIVAGNAGGADLRGFDGSSAASYSDACLGGGAHPPGAGNVCANPLLADPGPGHADVHETQYSPTVDHGSSALVPGDLSTDYEGDLRRVGPAVDMGADELTAPTAVTSRTKAVRAFRATLKAAVNANTRPTAYRFEYGETSAYGRSTGARWLPAGDAIELVTEQVRGLKPHRSYHYRIVATNRSGTAVGFDQTLRTDPDPFGGVRLQAGRVSVKGGRARIRVSCPSGAPSGCAGTLRLHSVGSVGKKPKKVELGRADFRIPTGVEATVTMKLSAEGRKALKNRGRLGAVARATAHDAYVTRTTTASVTLRLK